MSLHRGSLAVVMVFMVICGSAQTASPTSPSNNTRATGTNSTEIEVVRAVKASYPSAAFAQSVQGQVVVKVVISETGDVEKAEVISGDPVLAKAAIEAAKQWKFEKNFGFINSKLKERFAETDLTFNFDLP